MPTDPPPPRRNKHLARWFLVLALAVFGWSGWQAYAYRSALSQAKALGWKVQYTDPVETIRKNWKAAFKKETWLDGVTDVIIPTGEAFEQHLATFHRLNPKELLIDNAATLRDLSALQPCTRLRSLWLYGCKGLTNVDTLKNLSALQSVSLDGCTGLTNVDGLKNLTALQMVWLADCTGLANVDGLKNLSALKSVGLDGCKGLTNVDALKNLSALEQLSLTGCTVLTNVDGLKNLSKLREIWLFMCKGLTKESVAELKAALPNAKIYGP